MTPLPSTQVLERLLSRGYASAGDAASHVCRALCDELGMEVAFVTRLEGEDLELLASSDEQGLGVVPGRRMPLAASFCGRALAGRAPHATADLARGPYADLPLRAALGVSSYAMVPLRGADGSPFGTLCVLDRRSVLPDEDGTQLMRLLGGLLAREQEFERVRDLEEVASRALAHRAVELESSQDRYRTLVDEMRDIVVRVAADGTIEYVNRAWTELTGLPIDAIIGKDCFDHVHPEDRTVAAEHLMALTAGGDPTPREVRFRSFDGSYRWMAVAGRALLDDSGALAGFTGMLQDVTDRRVSEARVRAALGDAETARDEAQHALAEAERQSHAKSEFLSRMSHELRTPLNAILGFGQLLELADLGGEDAEHVELIMGAGRHLLELINEVLDVTRIESGRLSLSLEPVLVGAVVADSLALVRTAAADRGLRVTAPATQSTDYVVADLQRLTQVLVNLLSNAVKYNVAGGRLNVEQAVLSPDEHPGPGGEHGWLRLSVADTGPGIPDHLIAAAFTPFERLGAENSGTEGSGLGLPLSKTLVEAMGGRIGVASRPGRGSTFFVDLPAAAPLAVVPAENPPAAEPTETARRATVVYIEDNRSNITLMERVLARRPDVRLVVATDGAAGLQLVRSLLPDLVLLDLHLPVLTGDEVLAAVRADADARLRTLPVIVVTADLTTGTERRLVEAGATAFLSKPIDVAGLLAVVDRHLALAAQGGSRDA